MRIKYYLHELDVNFYLKPSRYFDRELGVLVEVSFDPLDFGIEQTIKIDEYDLDSIKTPFELRCYIANEASRRQNEEYASKDRKAVEEIIRRNRVDD